MRRKIPTTSALLVLDAAARHGSFSRAADELFTTEGAVSRQIARLEDYLGAPLFARVKNRVHLVDDAKAYSEKISELLISIEQATLDFVGQPSSGVLELAAIPTFTSKWVIPRLPDFNRRYPDVVINITERAEPFLFADSKFDAAIHFDHPAWASMMKHVLFTEELEPICAPALLPSSQSTPADLMHLPLLHKRGTSDSWKKWWDKANVKHPNPYAGARYDLYGMIIEAAKAGLGMALVPRLYVSEELQTGRLALATQQATATDKSYCVVYPQQQVGQWPLTPFIEWLLEQASAFTSGRTTAVDASARE
jgi:DNA-binding transcriptional LysR family regulator